MQWSEHDVSWNCCTVKSQSLLMAPSGCRPDHLHSNRKYCLCSCSRGLHGAPECSCHRHCPHLSPLTLLPTHCCSCWSRNQGGFITCGCWIVPTFGNPHCMNGSLGVSLSDWVLIALTEKAGHLEANSLFALFSLSLRSPRQLEVRPGCHLMAAIGRNWTRVMCEFHFLLPM